jgi:hypothetical protein
VPASVNVPPLGDVDGECGDRRWLPVDGEHGAGDLDEERAGGDVPRAGGVRRDVQVDAPALEVHDDAGWFGLDQRGDGVGCEDDAAVIGERDGQRCLGGRE